MNSIKKEIDSLKWIHYISRRFSKVDRKGRTQVTSTLSSLGVCFGVMALIVVISVMNGFQMEFIDAIMELSSYHVRVDSVPSEEDLLKWCNDDPMVTSVSPFYEAQGLMLSSNGKEGAALVRAVDPDVMEFDEGFCREALIISGEFDISGEGLIVLGNELARSIGAKVGGTVSIFALSGGSDVAMFSTDRDFIVSGIFFSKYSDINAAYAFVGLDAAEKYFGSGAKKQYGIKIKDSGKDQLAISRLESAVPGVKARSWRDYNRTFFGALRIEKNMLMILVFLIFVVVAVNIYNGMRRMVYERREDIAVLAALGGGQRNVLAVFVVKGFITGLAGALPGLVLGLFICKNMGSVFNLLSRIQFWAQYLFALIFNPTATQFVQENPMFSVYASIPPRMVFGEITAIFFFGILSSLAASWIASRQILHVSVAEVLHDD